MNIRSSVNVILDRFMNGINWMTAAYALLKSILVVRPFDILVKFLFKTYFVYLRILCPTIIFLYYKISVSVFLSINL